MKKEDYKECLKYIESYWEKITYSLKKDNGIYIGLPNKFVAPNADMFKEDQFYWDSYFIILGLVVSKKIKLAKGIVNNFVYLHKRFNIIPARNRFYNLGISQPPFLTSMALEIYSRTKNKNWLKKVAKVASKELKNYWMQNKKPETRLVYRGLSRYCDHHVCHEASEHESGWDMTSRFNAECLNYLPVDLNSLLYKYEKDLAKIYLILKKESEEKEYLKKAEKRKKDMNRLMWNEELGFFFDYNHIKKKESKFYSLAGFYPLWSEMATNEQAAKMVKHLKKFEFRGGITNTQKSKLSREYKQWDYPNGWPNKQWIIIKGLLNYGYRNDAMRLAKKWLDLNKKVFEKTGKFWEKYDVVNCKIGKSARYKTQEGFGWTNGVFVRIIDELFPL